jgi:hypothetical protein
MKKILSVAIVFLLLFSSCASTNKTKQVDLASRDGSSFEKAIVITEKTESTGVDAEYKWLAVHYPGYSSTGQSLNMNDKRPYDIIYITTKEGDKKQVYFDISNYFGKW